MNLQSMFHRRAFLFAIFLFPQIQLEVRAALQVPEAAASDANAFLRNSDQMIRKWQQSFYDYFLLQKAKVAILRPQLHFSYFLCNV